MWIRAVLCTLLCVLSACAGSDSSPPEASTTPSPPPSSSPPPGQPPTNPPPTSNPAGPWPVADLTIYAAAQSLSGTIIDASPDDAQNIWAVTPDALYVLRPGQQAFRRYTAADGLHVQTYTDPATGQVTVSNITAMVGGRGNEAFVGYRGYEQTIPPPAPPSCCVPNADFSDPRWHLGQADKVTLNTDGTLAIRRYEFICDVSFNCWEERSVRRMIFGHGGTAVGHLFIGFDHGVTHVFNDTWGDHTHVQTFWHYDDGREVQRMGEQYGLALFPNGDLLSAGGYGVGTQPWHPDPKAWWVQRFLWAFTTFGPATPYNNGEHDLLVPEGYREDNRGAAVTPDGTAWWVSLRTGLSSYNDSTAGGNYFMTRHYTNVSGLPTTNLMDIAADPDGSLWIVDGGGRLLRFNPTAQTVQVWPGVSNVRRVVMDTTVTPRALYVSMGSQGLAVIRAR
jgi:hypothetical protein